MINRILKTLMAAMVCTLFFTGCATTQNLLGTENYTMETVPHNQTFFRQIRAVEDDGAFRISGKLRLKGTLGVNIPDYVEVALLDEEGTVVETQRVGYYPRVLKGRNGHREARFSANFSKTPPPGTSIRLSTVN